MYLATVLLDQPANMCPFPVVCNHSLGQDYKLRNRINPNQNWNKSRFLAYNDKVDISPVKKLKASILNRSFTGRFRYMKSMKDRFKPT